MLVFYILLLIPLAMQHFSIKGIKFDYQKKNIRALAFFFIFLTILVMLRHESIGNDTQNYINKFVRYSNLNWGRVHQMSFEPGYSYINKIISLVTDEPQVFLGITAVITSALIFPTYKRLCVDSSLTIVLFCVMSTFTMMFSGIRQMLAIGIGFVAYEFTRKKKLIPFVFAVLLAMTFHTSAFMLVFMYPLYHAKITQKWLLAVVPSLAVVYVFNVQIFSFLSLFIERYTEYNTKITETGAYTMIILFAAFTVFSFLVPDEASLDSETIGLRNFLLFALVLQMFAPLHSLAMRMNYYYIIFIPLLLPKIIEHRSERWKQVAKVGRNVMVVFFLVYFFVNAYGGAGLKVFPYHFFWESVI